jgi:glycosyltransferase involved in cell wall biosynthesis
MINLTIVIPTYKRIEKLTQRAREILPQLDADDRLLIFDNATPEFDPGKHPELADPRITIQINHANIGGNANIAKCMSAISTGWIWLTSDDDPIQADAIKILKHEIDRMPHCCYINFVAKGTRKRPKDGWFADGMSNFLNLNDGFENTLLISNGAFNVTLLRPHMKDAHSAIWMNCPHLAPVISCLQSGGSMLYSTHSLIEWSEPDPSDSWPIVVVFHLLELPTLVKNKKQADQLRTIIAKALPSQARFIINLCAMQIMSGPDWRIRRFARKVLYQLTYGRNPAVKLMAFLLYLSLHTPRLTLLIFSFIYLKTKKRDLHKTIQKRVFQPFL